jgi:isochorismate pyruvate lyase
MTHSQSRFRRRRPPRAALARALPLVGAALLFVSCLGQARAEDAGKPVEPPAFWGSPSVDGGQCCASLSEVRGNIDRIDREIIRLMAERGRYVAEAGRFKADPAAVGAPARVEEITARIKKMARENGLAETVAERAYRAMIAAFEDFEREEWIMRNAGGAPGEGR